MQELKKIQETMLEDLLKRNTKAPYLNHNDRITAYGNGYYRRFHEVLENYYNILRWFVGEDPFTKLVSNYITKRPPQEININLYGDDFDDYLRKEGREQLWADIATTQKSVHHAHLRAPANGFDMQSAQNIKPEKWAGAVFHFQPSAHLFKTTYPVHEIYNAFSNDKEHIPSISPRAMFYTTYREDGHIFFENLGESQWELLKLLQSGTPLAQAIEKVLNPDESDQLFQYFHKWQTYNLIADIQFP